MGVALAANFLPTLSQQMVAWLVCFRGRQLPVAPLLYIAFTGTRASESKRESHHNSCKSGFVSAYGGRSALSQQPWPAAIVNKHIAVAYHSIIYGLPNNYNHGSPASGGLTASTSAHVQSRTKLQ